MVTVAWACPLLPDKSEAVKVTIVAPSGNIAGALLETGREPSTASFAVEALRKVLIVVSVFAVPLASVAATVILAGAVTTGGVVSEPITATHSLVGVVNVLPLLLKKVVISVVGNTPLP